MKLHLICLWGNFKGKKKKQLPKHTSDFGCQVNTRGVQLVMKSTETQTDKSSFEVILCEQSNQTDEKAHVEIMISRSLEEEDPSLEEITK